MNRSLALDDLVDDRFLAALEHLRVTARTTPSASAEQHSPDRGTGIEFKDYRGYAPGDDLRRIDWNVYRRTGRFYLRLYEELEDLPLYLLPDISASAWFENPPRVRAGLRVALALGAICLGQHDKVAVIPISDDARMLVRPMAGKGRVLALARRMLDLTPGGKTDLVRSLATFGAMPLRPGLACVISDYFDPQGIAAVTAALTRLRHRLLLVRLTRESDRAPDFAGELRLIDCESGVTSDVAITPRALESHRAEYDAFATSLAQFAAARGADPLEVDVDRDVVPQLERLFVSGSLAT
jgi:uncharacterized protein (DUF58 family)